MQDTPASAISGMTGGNGSHGIDNTTTGAGSNITGSLSLQNMLARLEDYLGVEDMLMIEHQPWKKLKSYVSIQTDE